MSKKTEMLRIPEQLERKNPLLRTARVAMTLLKDQIVTSLILLFQGLLFFFLPSGDLEGLVNLIALGLLLAAIINMAIHWFTKDRTNLDVFLVAASMGLAAFAIYCLAVPNLVEPLLRLILAIITLVTNGINLVSVLKLENKRTWRFVVGLCASIGWLVLGVAMLIAPEQIIAEIQHGIGLLLVLNAVTNIWYILRTRAASMTKQDAPQGEEAAGQEAAPEERTQEEPEEN